MATETCWTIEHSSIGSVQVRGFSRPHNARRHANKHFLAPAEDWGKLHPVVAPAELAHMVRRFGVIPGAAELPPGYENTDAKEVLDRAADAYVGVVRVQTGRQKITVCATGLRESGGAGGAPRPSIAAATSGGVFVVFERTADVSELVSAYRPRCWSASGMPTTTQFAQAARDKVAAFVSESKTLKACSSPRSRATRRKQ